MIAASQITGLVLAGGRGSRMGGIDKGLQRFRGTPLAQHALLRLRAQESAALIGAIMLNANRNLSTYEAFGLPVLPDMLTDYAGPLAGILSGLAHIDTPWLLTVPCDSPLFPLDLVERLASTFDDPHTEIAMAAAPDEEGRLRQQPVFCLLRRELLGSLVAFTEAGGRAIGRWANQHHTVTVAFDLPDDDPQAFFNANTLAELQSLEGG